MKQKVWNKKYEMKSVKQKLWNEMDEMKSVKRKRETKGEIIGPKLSQMVPNGHKWS